MTTLRVIEGGGKPDDSELVEEACRVAAMLVETVKAGGRYWVLLDGEEMDVHFVGEALEMMALAEEAARDTKRAILGLA